MKYQVKISSIVFAISMIVNVIDDIRNKKIVQQNKIQIDFFNKFI